VAGDGQEAVDWADCEDFDWAEDVCQSAQDNVSRVGTHGRFVPRLAGEEA
jgi:hypothetical protein